LKSIEENNSKMAADEIRAKMKIAAAQSTERMIDKSLTVGELQTKKLAQLQAANETVQQINKLAKVPQQLKKAQQSLAKINEKAIQRDIDRLMVKVKRISNYILESLKRHGLNKPKEIISGTITRNFTQIAEMRKQLDVLFKKVLPRSTVNQRTRALENYVDKAGSLTRKLRGNSQLNTELSNTSVGNVMTLQGVMNAIAGPGGALLVAKANIEKKIRFSSKAIQAVAAIINDLNRMPGLKAVVKLGTALTQQRDLTIRTARTNVNLNLVVKVDSSEFAKKMIDVDIVDGKGSTKIATTRDVKDATRP